MSEEIAQDNIPSYYKGGVLAEVRYTSRHYKHCRVPGCSTKGNVENVSYHKFPKAKKLNKLWKVKCHLVDKLSPSSCICSKHFLKTDYFYGPRRYQLLLKNAVPSQNLPVGSYPRKATTVQSANRLQRLLNRSSQNSRDSSMTNAVIIKQEIDLEMPMVVKEEKQETQEVVDVKPLITTSKGIVQQKTKEERGIAANTVNINSFPRYNVMDLLNTRSKLNAWTGIPTFFLLRKIEERVGLTNPKIMANNLSLLECVLLCFINLKTKLSFTCLTSIFHISTSTVSTIFYGMLPLIRKALEDVDYFSSTIQSTDNQLIPLRMYGYNEVRAICDSAGEFKGEVVDPLSTTN